MSAYIVEKETIERIVTHMMNSANPSTEAYKKIATATGQLLWDLNQLSVNSRYRESESETTPIYIHRDRRASRLQVYKSLRNYLYQSCEGNCMVTDCYKDMTKLRDQLANDIVCNLPEYTKGDWT